MSEKFPQFHHVRWHKDPSILTLSHPAIGNLHMTGIKDGAAIERGEILNTEKIGNGEEEMLSLEKHTRVESRNLIASQHFA